MTMDSPKLNHPTPPGSLSRRRKNSDKDNVSKAAQLIKRLSNPLAPQELAEISRTISPELPMVHYRNINMTGSGSLGRKQYQHDEEQKQQQQPLLQGNPQTNTLTQSQILNSCERNRRNSRHGVTGSNNGTPCSLSPGSPGFELEAGVLPPGLVSPTQSSLSRDSRTSPGTSSGALPPSSRSEDLLSQSEEDFIGRKKSTSSIGSLSQGSMGTPASPTSVSSFSPGSPLSDTRPFLSALDEAHQKLQRNNSAGQLSHHSNSGPIYDNHNPNKEINELNAIMKDLGFHTTNMMNNDHVVPAHVIAAQVSMPPLPPNGGNGRRSQFKNGARPKSLSSNNPNNFNSPSYLHHSGSSPQILHHSTQRVPIKTSPSSPASLMHLGYSNQNNLFNQPIPENPPERPPPPAELEGIYYGIPAVTRQTSGPAVFGFPSTGHSIPYRADSGVSRGSGLQKQRSLPESKDLSKKEHHYQNAMSLTSYGTIPSPTSHGFGAKSKVQYIPNIPVNGQEPKRKDTPKLSNIPQHMVNNSASPAKNNSPTKLGSGKGGPSKSSSAKKKKAGGTSPPPLPPPPSENFLPPTPPVRKESSKLAMVGPLSATSVQSHTAHITPSMNGVPTSPSKEKPLHFSEHSAFTPVTPQGSPQRKPKKEETPSTQKVASHKHGGNPAAVAAAAAAATAASKIPKLNRSPATPSSTKSDSRLLRQQDHKRKPVDFSVRGARGSYNQSGRPPIGKQPTEPSTSESSDNDYHGAMGIKRGPKYKPPAPPFQVKRRQRFNPPPRLSKSLDYIPSDIDDNASSMSSRAESPLGNKFPILDPEAFMPISTLVKQLADNISISSMGSGMSSEMSRSDSNLNYDSGSAAYESEYDNYRPGMASDEDYFVPEPISDVDIDMFDDINIDNVTISDTYSLDMPLAFLGPKKITDV